MFVKIIVTTLSVAINATLRKLWGKCALGANPVQQLGDQVTAFIRDDLVFSRSYGLGLTTE